MSTHTQAQVRNKAARSSASVNPEQMRIPGLVKQDGYSQRVRSLRLQRGALSGQVRVFGDVVNNKCCRDSRKSEKTEQEPVVREDA